MVKFDTKWKWICTSTSDTLVPLVRLSILAPLHVQGLEVVLSFHGADRVS